MVAGALNGKVALVPGASSGIGQAAAIALAAEGAKVATAARQDRFDASIRSLRADDIARAVVYVVTQPDHASVDEVLVRPTDQGR